MTQIKVWYFVLNIHYHYRSAKWITMKTIYFFRSTIHCKLGNKFPDLRLFYLQPQIWATNKYKKKLFDGWNYISLIQFVNIIKMFITESLNNDNPNSLKVLFSSCLTTRAHSFFISSVKQFTKTKIAVTFQGSTKQFLLRDAA